jgi:PKD repeat protein
VSIALPAGQTGDTIAAAFTVANQGSVGAPATTSRLRIGSDPTFSLSYPVVATVATPPLNAGASTTQTTTFTVPNLPAGTYYLFLSVDEDHVSGDINPANDVKRSAGFAVQGACPLTCAAVVPSNAQVVTPVSFSLLQAPTCSTVTAVWNFGDNSSSNQLSPAHAYASPGTYHWTVTLTTPDSHICSSSGNITITAPAAPPKRRAVRH